MGTAGAVALAVSCGFGLGAFYVIAVRWIVRRF